MRTDTFMKGIDMRTILAAAAALALIAGSALGQTTPVKPSSTTPAVSSPNTTNPQAPVPGANSFTEGQAQSRIEAKGYSNVSGLQKDTNGIWRGKAMKDGKSVNLSLDFQGNIVTN
jgi:opacity protein-like surface antigen